MKRIRPRGNIKNICLGCHCGNTIWRAARKHWRRSIKTRSWQNREINSIFERLNYTCYPLPSITILHIFKVHCKSKEWWLTEHWTKLLWYWKLKGKPMNLSKPERHVPKILERMTSCNCWSHNRIQEFCNDEKTRILPHFKELSSRN